MTAPKLRPYQQDVIDKLVELDRWDSEGGDRPMPQPKDYGLRIKTLSPSEVLWRAAT